MSAIISVAAGLLALVGIVFLAARHSGKRWTEEEYEEERSSGTATGSFFLSTQALFQPGARHALEQINAERAETIDAEGPPVPGDDSTR